MALLMCGGFSVSHSTGIDVAIATPTFSLITHFRSEDGPSHPIQWYSEYYYTDKERHEEKRNGMIEKEKSENGR